MATVCDFNMTMAEPSLSKFISINPSFHISKPRSFTNINTGGQPMEVVDGKLVPIAPWGDSSVNTVLPKPDISGQQTTLKVVGSPALKKHKVETEFSKDNYLKKLGAEDTIKIPEKLAAVEEYTPISSTIPPVDYKESGRMAGSRVSEFFEYNPWWNTATASESELFWTAGKFYGEKLLEGLKYSDELINKGDRAIKEAPLAFGNLVMRGIDYTNDVSTRFDSAVKDTEMNLERMEMEKENENSSMLDFGDGE
jgi:hypothetical protein